MGYQLWSLLAISTHGANRCIAGRARSEVLQRGRLAPTWPSVAQTAVVASCVLECAVGAAGENCCHRWLDLLSHPEGTGNSGHHAAHVQPVPVEPQLTVPPPHPSL